MLIETLLELEKEIERLISLLSHIESQQLQNFRQAIVDELNSSLVLLRCQLNAQDCESLAITIRELRDAADINQTMVINLLETMRLEVRTVISTFS